MIVFAVNDEKDKGTVADGVENLQAVTPVPPLDKPKAGPQPSATANPVVAKHPRIRVLALFIVYDV